ncbi:MAG: PQQ-like beta-propeller repeat protein [Chloroflexi bacterium]|nr:PQQ-like beta-propeller repeat protein [Chloroflexota bacterium]
MLALVALVAAACVGNLSPRGGWAAPVPAGEWVYQATRDGRLFRIDARTGQPDAAWAYPPDNQKFGVIYGTPLVTEDAVYAAAYSCRGDQCSARVYAVSTGDATSLWSEQYFAIDTEIVGPLALHGNTLLFGTSNIGRNSDSRGYLYAIDVTADANKPLAERVGDRLKWRVAVEGKVWGGPAIDGDTAYFGTMDRNVYAVDLSDKASSAGDNGQGRIAWRFESAGAFVARPLVAGGKLYIGDFDGKLYQLDVQSRRADGTSKTLDPRREWAIDLGGWVWSEPALKAGLLYAGTLAGDVFAVDVASGRFAWASPAKIEGQVIGAPAVLEGPGTPGLAVPSSKEDIWILDLRTGNVLGEFNTRAAVDGQPVARDGFIYAHSRNDQLQTFAISSRARVNCIDTLKRGACS